MAEKTKFPLYLSNNLREELASRFREDGSRSQTDFVENALKFYLDYLAAKKSSDYLPIAISSCIEGRLGMFEDRMSALLFRLAVETDMTARILNDQLELPEEYLRKCRTDSVLAVKKTNGRLSFGAVGELE